ncbi:LuxR C-terminal-related transcriptional regulator [Nocardia sp. NPDC058658]|uniref:LuxR C-terminal-related transcriptional regulator n=1 Tax=Nocardia sp. NPDC058658 TaxID=3346580 RepID=UPI0036472155
MSQSHSVSEVRLGVIDDHSLLIDGLRLTLAADPRITIVATGASVQAMLDVCADIDIAILDLSLPDGSTPSMNVAALTNAGIANVLVLTAGDRPDLVREAARAGVLGVVRKSEPGAAILAAITAASAGQPIGTADWATAIDADDQRPRFAPREEEVLALYAAGESAEDAAALMEISTHTVNMYLRRIRSKYSEFGTPVPSRAALRDAAQRDGFAPRPWWRARR